MLDTLQFENFKSWRDTGEIRLAPITGFFGTNSSGKSSLLQFLLMLKQTVESNDQQRVLHLGSDRTYVDLGTSLDILHHHSDYQATQIAFSLSWYPFDPIALPLSSDLRIPTGYVSRFKFETAIDFDFDEIRSRHFNYFYLLGAKKWYQVGMRRIAADSPNDTQPTYLPELSGFSSVLLDGNLPLPHPVKSYGFPSEVKLAFWELTGSTGFLQTLPLAFENAFNDLYYLGPLRDFPKRSYVWSGERPQDVGRRGELAIPALLAARKHDPKVEIKVAYWLKTLGLVADFEVVPIAEHRRDYEVRLKLRSHSSQSVLITDVGFGVSQILPVLVLCYYVPKGATILLEQPEIHLHPSVQAGLADVFIDVAKTRNVQIIVESHSEHLLRRWQRRIAEEHITEEETALYFCDMDDEGISHLRTLEVDTLGNINNWPEGFFGDEMGDLMAMTEAAIQRQMAGETP